jgi:hypothetical protein
VPVVLILHPAKPATPEVAFNGLVVQVSVPGPPRVGVPAVIDRVTALLSPVTTLPALSSTLTTG